MKRAESGDDRRRGLNREADRDAEPGALGVAAKRCAVLAQRPPEDLAHRMLEVLVAEPLGLLDRDPLGGVRGKQRRVGHELVELAGDLRASPASAAPSIFIAGTVTPGKRSAFSTPFEITGIRSVRL